MRGWSRGIGRALWPTGVVPAHAGVVPRHRPGPVAYWRGPRACGGGPPSGSRSPSWSRWSPRMRGWSLLPRLADDLGAVVPAHAGVVPSRPCACPAPRCGPRACGGGPVTPPTPASVSPWSPRMRGWSRMLTAGAWSGVVVPAHAGVVPSSVPRSDRQSCGPRACGGGPRPEQCRRPNRQWSPRMRGWSRPLVQLRLGQAVVPAHAGVVPSRRARSSSAGCGPRACGGGPVSPVSSRPLFWWSPRMRGWSPRRHGGGG